MNGMQGGLKAERGGLVCNLTLGQRNSGFSMDATIIALVRHCHINEDVGYSTSVELVSFTNLGFEVTASHNFISELKMRLSK